MQYVKKEERDQVDFLRIGKHQSFPQFDTINFGGYITSAQSTQNNKFAISWQYFKRKMRDEFEFLHEGDAMIFIGHRQVFPKYPE